MGSVLKYAAVNTKVRALEGKMLKKSEYTQLMESSNYYEAIKFLKENTSYRELLSINDLEALHRGKLELILKKYYINYFYKFSHYFTGNYKELINILFMRFEIEDLKVIIRGKFIGRAKEEIYSYLTYESPLNNIDYQELLNASDLSAVVERLKYTPYYKHIYNIVSTTEKEGLFRLEMALDFVYFSSLRKVLKKLSKEDRKIIEEVNGIYTDLLNIQWIYRGIKYYKLKPEELYNYTIYHGYKLKKEELKRLCYVYDLNEFYNEVGKLPYKEVFINCRDRDYLVEREILSYIKKSYEKYKRTNALNISILIAYMELFLIEIRDITSIVENKRYNIQKVESVDYITATL